MLVPDEALGALKLEAILTQRERRRRRVRDWIRVWLWAQGKAHGTRWG